MIFLDHYLLFLMTKLFRILLSMLLLTSTFSPQMLMTTSVSADYTAPYDLEVTKTVA